MMIVMIVISFGMVVPSIASFDHIKVANLPNSVPYNPKKINQNGMFLRYHGYAVISRIDPSYRDLANAIEKFIHDSSFGRSYSAVPANTYHTTVYAIPNRRQLNRQELEDRNSKAVCNLEQFQGERLYIKSASLVFGKSTIGMTVELEENNLQMIREGLAAIYGNPKPKVDTFHITLAYVFRKMEYINMNDWNYLNELVGLFNGASLLPPAVYQFESMKEYIPFSHSCKSRTRPSVTNYVLRYLGK